MRYLIVILALTYFSAHSQDVPKATQNQKGGAANQEVAITPPAGIKTPVSGEIQTASQPALQKGGESHGWATKFIEVNLTDVLLAVFTFLLWLSTRGLWRSTDKLWQASKEATDIAQQSADAAKKSADAMAASQRPWVSADITLADGLKHDANGVTITLLFVLQNTGESPALNVDVTPEVFAAFGGGIDVIGRQRAIADRMTVRRAGFGYTLFPGERFPLQMSMSLSTAEIERFDEFMKGLGFTQIPGERGSHLPPVMILGTIGYRDIFNPEVCHHTGFILDLSLIKRAAPQASFALPRWEDVPVEDLRLSRSFIASGYTS